MAIELQCSCGQRQRVSERAAGRQVRCAACGPSIAVASVPAAPRSLAPPARRAEATQPRYAPAQSRSNTWMWLLILIPILLLGAGAVGVMVVVGVFLFSSSAPAARPAASVAASRSTE